MNPNYYHRPLPVLTLMAWAMHLSCRASASTTGLDVKYDFPSGLSPNAGLIQGANGNFYGVSATGGGSNFGGVYEITGQFQFTNFFPLTGTNGATPLAPLIQTADGTFYGTASSGGSNNYGTVFSFESGGPIKVVARFGLTNGSTPLGPLVEGTNQWLYGTTYSGGTNNEGTIFAITTAGVLTNVYSFGGSNSGANPAAGLIKGARGNLYGTTEYGGSAGFGTVFSITYAGVLSNLCSFGNDTGAYPGALVEDSNGNLYGATISGGAADQGTIFKVSRNTLSTLFSFGVYNGANPNSPLTLTNNDTIYGTTKAGGEFNAGTIFELNTNGTLTVLASFAGTNGAVPLSGLLVASNGNFYGTTSQGGSNSAGEFYELALLPFITSPPKNLIWVTNSTNKFSVTAGGTAPLGYQWFFGATTSNLNVIADATNNSYEVTNEQLSNVGLYMVVVSNAFGTNSASASLSLPVPAIAIHSPPATVTSNTLAVSGTASDSNGLSGVLCQLNGNSWFPASGTTTWNTTLTLQPGSNLFQAESLGPLSNASAIKSVEIFYVFPSKLTLTNTRGGRITGQTNGAPLDVGKPYTLVAHTTNSDYLFSNWVTSAGLSNNSSTLHFLMSTNLTITANFVSNVFVAAAGGGTYNGLFYQTNGVTEETAGMLANLKVTPTGAYSGSLLLGGASYGLAGSFNVSGYASNDVNHTTPEGGPVAVEMTLDWTNGQIMGSVSGGGPAPWQSPLYAQKAAASPASGQYTVLLAPGANPTNDIPPGDGYILLSNHNSSVTLSGALADGTTFSQAVALGVSNDVPVYASLYNKTGLLLGWIGLSNGTLQGETNMTWIKPRASSGIYTNGFTNDLLAAVSAWSHAPADYLPSATLAITNTNTSLALDFAIAITNTTLLKTTNTPTNSLTGLFYPNTGLLKITFGNGAGKATTTGYAAILGNSTNGGGYFVTKTNAGTISLSP